MIKVKPLFDKVLIEIEVSKTEEKTSSGIFLAKKEAEELEKATVIAVGEECITLKKGDTILFKSYSIDTIEIDKKKYSFIEEKSAFATV